MKDGREDFVVHAFLLDHPVPCTGYLLVEPPPLPHLRVERAIALGVKPGPLMGKLKRVSCPSILKNILSMIGFSSGFCFIGRICDS